MEKNLQKNRSQREESEYMMTELDKKTQYNLKYAKENLKRIPLDVQKSEYDNIKAAADNAGEKVNAYIKEAIRQRIEREKPTSTTPAAVEVLNTDSVDLSRLHSDISYQFEIRDIFGNEVLAELLKKPLSAQKSIPEE